MPDCCPFCGSEDLEDGEGFTFICGCCGRSFESPDYFEYDDDNDKGNDDDDDYDWGTRNCLAPNYDPEESDELYEYDGFGDDGYDTGYDGDYI